MAFNQVDAAVKNLLDPATHMGPVTLAVSNLAQSVDFYTRVLGMRELQTGAGADGKSATLGAGETPLLHLREVPGGRRQPGYSTGLYHVAILVPTRADLGRVILSLAREQYPIGGFGDHYVSEAMYLDDPDGIGLEIYRDRPRSEWQWDGDQVVMGTEMVDVDAVIKSVDDPNAPYTGMPDGTTIGHVHLRVGDIPQARRFYSDILGFDVIAGLPTALFVSAGRYHHHLGMNIWHSRNAPPVPADAVGMREYTILVPTSEALAQLVTRLEAGGIVYQHEESDVLLNDPWQNAIRLTVEPASA
ncbi:MAG: glyoxalase [Anaerolineaceae bacterium]|nr:glyoxalase [Anaerolineaceae bacterium]